nr:hypothetical protein [Tanacetum cinerariifolium]
MKEVFDQMEADVDQHVVDKKCDEIKRKNLLIKHENLIAECLSKEVFFIATNSELIVSTFTKMHDGHTVVQADECDAFDYDVDEAPTTQTMFMENLSFADPVYAKAGQSYDSDILSKVHDHENYQDAVCELHGVHEMHDHVQPNCVVDSNAEYTSDSNMIPYDQYAKDNAELVVQNTVCFVPHDAPLMIINEMHKQTV